MTTLVGPSVRLFLCFISILMDPDQSVLFRPLRVGPMVLANRFVRSATGENLGTKDGLPVPLLAKKLQQLAQGEVGLIISGLIATSSNARTGPTMHGI
jgi:2,4-dienoyl-CoA reductase-like NADH-dependent reductase (Old Yellow Enzyme family)